MITRYTRPAMGRIWEDQNKYQRWLDVELAVTETLAAEGIIPKDAAAEIKATAAAFQRSGGNDASGQAFWRGWHVCPSFAWHRREVARQTRPDAGPCRNPGDPA